MNAATNITWTPVCNVEDILPFTGVCALFNDKQVAIFRTANDELFAVDNFDPFSEANVLSRGLVGDLQGNLVVASPLYKQHFILSTGQCLEDDTVSLNTYGVRNNKGQVELSA